MEAAYSSETMEGTYYSTRRQNPEDYDINPLAPELDI